MTLDIYGRQLPAPFAFYDPESSAWKTSRPTLLSDSTRCSLTLPAWGMTLAGALYELRTPELLTSEPDSSSLLPTPVVTDMGRGKTVEEWDAWTARMQARHGNGNGHGRSLEIEAQRLLPTPRASDANGSGPHGSGGPDLRTAIQLLPTPTASDAKGCSSARPRRPGQAPTGDTLTDAVTILVGDRMRLLPTPQASDADGGRTSKDPTTRRPSGAKKALTLADAIRHGVTTSPRSDDGKPSSAA